MKSTIVGWAHRSLSLCGVVALGLAVGSAGCQKKTPSGAQTAKSGQPAAAKAPAQPVEDKVAATVDGTVIMESQVQRGIEERYGPVLAKYATEAPELVAQHRKQFRGAVLEALVVDHLLSEEAKKANIPQVTDQELTVEMNKRLATMNPPVTMEQFQKEVEGQGYDFAVMKKNYAQNLRYEKLLAAKSPEAFTTTEAEAKKYYDENTKEFQVPEQVRASHILIRPTDPNTDPNQAKVRAKRKAEDLLKKIKEGADFATLAKENSDCPSKAQGGDLGLFSRDKMVKPFADAAFALKVGQVSEVVETPFGYHIIKLTEHHDPNQITFDKAKADIINTLAEQKKEQAARKYVESLRQNAKIEYPSEAAGPGSAGAQPAAPKAEPSKSSIVPAPKDPNAKK